jgi:hypothetical protein
MPRKKPEAQGAAERHIYIREVAEILDRRMATLRKWEQLGVLPDELRPQRGQRGWRYWTESQVEGLKEWLRETERWPGKGLPFYNPTEEKLTESIHMMRRPRKGAARTRNPNDARSRIDPSSAVPVMPTHSKYTHTEPETNSNPLNKNGRPKKGKILASRTPTPTPRQNRAGTRAA